MILKFICILLRNNIHFKTQSVRIPCQFYFSFGPKYIARDRAMKTTENEELSAARGQNLVCGTESKHLCLETELLDSPGHTRQPSVHRSVYWEKEQKMASCTYKMFYKKSLLTKVTFLPASKLTPVGTRILWRRHTQPNSKASS